MKTNIHFYLTSLNSSENESFQKNVVDKLATHVLCSNTSPPPPPKKYGFFGEKGKKCEDGGGGGGERCLTPKGEK